MAKTSKKEKKISVVISGMPSVGKTTAANAIAEKYKLKHVAGGDMLKEMAIEQGYALSGPEWWDTEAGMAFISERKKNPDFDKEVDRRLMKYLKSGNVVMTSYPMPWLVKDDGLKLWFHASQKKRAERLAGRDRISKSKALSIIRKRDRDNKKVYKSLYGICFGEDLTPFHYIIDTNKMTAQEVAKASTKIVEEYARSLPDDPVGE
ncbi:MAG: cytidylate kinase family protein [Thaumarchaeota archaeon]|nr:cytidylate kinase family protein [Nitrososphaerota archaeon]